MTVGIDADTLIWGLQSLGPRKGNPRQKDLVEMQMRAAILIDILEEDEEKIIVPTVLVGELLAGIDPKDHGKVVEALKKRFFLPEYDLRAASFAGELWQFHKGRPKTGTTQRIVVKADTMIVATAKAAGATTFYSHDVGCRQLATKIGMSASDLPLTHPNLFRNAEIRKQFGLD